jgi:O-antigen/teichoic acid export membrane protein
VLSLIPILQKTKQRVVGAARRHRVIGTKAFWVLSDQGVVSLGNFVTSLMLARHLGLKQLGIYAIIYELTLFLNSMQASLVLFPLIMRGAVADDQKLSRLAGRAMIVTLALAPVLGCGALAAGALLDSIVVGLWALVAMTLFQVQETLRRAMIAQIRYRSVIWGDAISYLGQAALICLLAAHHQLTLATAFQAFAITSAAGAIVQAIQIRPQFVALAEGIEFARKNWDYTRWVLYGNLSNLLTGSVFFWNLAFWWGRESVGVMQGLINVIRLANPLMLAFGSVIVPTVARARERRGLHGAKRMFNASLVTGLTGLTLLFSIPTIWPEQVLRVFYPANAENYLPHMHVLQIMTFCTLIIFAKEMTASFLNAIEQPKFSFAGQVCYTTAMVLLAMPLTARFGLTGMAIGATIAALIHLITNAMFVRAIDRGQIPIPAI